MDEGTRAAAGLLAGRRTVALTGAGLSTDSGIPDYRGPGSPPRAPMTYATFVSGEAARQRYWARSHVGWRRMNQAAPNDGHRALAAMERTGAVASLITQNVDGLHTTAGSRAVTDLHGRISEVVCLDCREVTGRDELHRRLDELNPGFGEPAAVDVAPDGDAELERVDGFRVAPCRRCSGVLKPHVVFFGENVPKPRVEHCFALVDGADAILVAGSSLTVLSGFRFVRHACRRGIPVVVVNRGPTRADEMVTLKVEHGCSEVLTGLAGLLGHTASPTVVATR